MTIPEVKRGTFLVIRVNGDEEDHEEKPSIRKIYSVIGCDTFDTVTLDKKRKIIMLVDDTGMVDGKPINPKATELYHSRCKPGTPFSIHGDVAIVNDSDFA